MEKSKLIIALGGISSARVGLIGDICLDAYWRADMKLSELSRETPHFPLPVVSETYSPGGGGNAANNIAALKPKSLTVLSVIGDDWRGDILRNELMSRGISDLNIIKSRHVTTNAYIKPMRMGISNVIYEDPRLDFVNTRRMPRECEDELIGNLERAANELDVLCVSDQMAVGVITDSVREAICRLAKNGLKVIVDSRDMITKYANALLKPNEVELSRATGKAVSDYEEGAKALSEMTNSSVLVTLGENGCAYCHGGNIDKYKAVKVSGEIDICGAGDTFLSALSCVLAGGGDMESAIAIASIASSVTIKKLGETGTATREEISDKIYKGECA